MIASLPMYWRDETAEAWRWLWKNIHELCGFGPEHLVLPTDLGRHWSDPNLVLSQTCSLPLRQGLVNQVYVLGSFAFDLPETPAGDYHSVILTRDGPKKAAHGRLAINAVDSQSGWAALWDWADGDLPDDRLLTGSHLASAQAVAEDEADLCAVDAVTWSLIERFDTELARHLCVLARTPNTPALPLITAQQAWAQPLRDTLAQATRDMPTVHRETLGLLSFCPREAGDYTALPTPPAP